MSDEPKTDPPALTTGLASAFVPSWLRWPPNCCETCVGWEASAHQDHVGMCNKGDSLDCGVTTDTRYRCPSFQRRSNA